MRNIIVLAAVALAFVPSLAAAQTVMIQSGFYDSFHDLAGNSIRESPTYPGYLTGLDWGGEWTQYHFDVSEFGTYKVTVKCWGTNNVPYHLQLIVMSSQGDDAQIIDLNFTGLGGCGT